MALSHTPWPQIQAFFRDQARRWWLINSSRSIKRRDPPAL
jgi:hypothetical protein